MLEAWIYPNWRNHLVSNVPFSHLRLKRNGKILHGATQVEVKQLPQFQLSRPSADSTRLSGHLQPFEATWGEHETIMSQTSQD